MSDQTNQEAKGTGVNLRPGDRFYIPAGGLKIRIKEDGTTGLSVSVAVDPWLPDMSANEVTSVETMEAITKNGFPVSSVCGTHVNACQKYREVCELLRYPGVMHLRHMAVIDGKQAIGILDLDKARGQVCHDDPKQSLLVEEIYEPLNSDHCLRGESPLIDYILTADERPFRLVELGGKLHTIDVSDLQKTPVRVLLFMRFAHLETLLARQLCTKQPQLLDVIGTDPGVGFGSLENSDIGPIRTIETYYIERLLKEAKRERIITIEDKEIPFLVKYRNRLAHGPRWYITRRTEVAALVSCAKKVSEFVREAAVGLVC